MADILETDEFEADTDDEFGYELDGGFGCRNKGSASTFCPKSTQSNM